VNLEKKSLRNASAIDSALVSGSYDIIGDIAIIRLLNGYHGNARNIAEEIMKLHKNVKTVLAQTNRITGEFRLRQLIHLEARTRHTQFTGNPTVCSQLT
jgi:tRNA G37 N-methylase Trm5